MVIHILKKMGLHDKVNILKRPGTEEDWIITDWPVYLAFSKKALKDPSYMKIVSRIIKEMKEDGTSRRILSKYDYIWNQGRHMPLPERYRQEIMETLYRSPHRDA